ncbi:MAG: response regulator transcription factor [Chloroflexi bacterium]|nr:response regulator transcription factor [Chloroflexota bacterium]
MLKNRVLVVDDEVSIRKFVAASLRAEGYDVSLASNGEEALRLVEESLPDLIILDIRMPGVDGFEVCRRIREWSQMPIIMLSALTEEEDKVKCLRMGADDYLVKPFGISELVARIEAVLRRAGANQVPVDEPSFATDDLQVNFAERRVTHSGQEVKLTPTEYSLLQQLVQHRGKVLTHGMLLRSIWGPQYGDEKEYVRVFVNRLRHKLGDDPANPSYIWTEPGVGYRFVVPG